MVMADQIADSFFHGFVYSGSFQKRFYQRSTFLLLMFPTGVAIFFTAQRAGNIIDYRCDLQRLLGSGIQLLFLSNQSGIGIYLQEMCDIMFISIRLCNHFANYIIYVHLSIPPAFCCLRSSINASLFYCFKRSYTS